MINQVFAVVDLETTGTNINDGAKIIQFSCSFVKNNKVINNFNTYINPEIKIPKEITQLTRISQKQTQTAPTFKQAAGKITSILSNTIFVAHNVNFDFPFLNQELKHVGYPQLKIKAIDTVTLSQILLPTLPSYRLRDISSYFNIVHKHPHSSDSDALATAQLLIILINRIVNLPNIIINQILKLQPNLPQNTLDIFKWAQIKQSKSQKQRLPTYLFVCHHIVLRKINIHRTNKILPSIYTHKSNQLDQSNIIKKMLTSLKLHPHSPIILEIPENFNRLLSIAYATVHFLDKNDKNGKQIIFILADSNGIYQFTKQVIPYLNAILPVKIYASNFAPAHDYIDLLKFSNSLFMPNQTKLDALIKSKILVWLTMTQTGNLNELNLKQSQYLNEISNQYTINEAKKLKHHNPFIKFDFVRLRNRLAQKAKIIIINQQTLVNHDWLYQRTFNPKHSYLVVDQAQMLLHQIQQTNHLKINFKSILIFIHQIKSLLNQSHHLNVKNIFNNNLHAYGMIMQINYLLDQLEANTDQAITYLNQRILNKEQLTTVMNEMEMTVHLKKHSQIVTLNRLFILILNQMEELNKISHRLINIFNSYRFHSSISQFTVNQYQNSLNKLIHEIKFIQRFVHNNNALLQTNGEHNGKVNFKLKLNHAINPDSIKIIYYRNGSESLTLHKLIQPFVNTIFAGSSMFIFKNNQVIKNAMQLHSKDMVFIYSKKCPLILKPSMLLYTDDFNSSLTESIRLKYLISIITKIYQANPYLTFVNIDDPKMIEPIYKKLASIHIDVLAEKISGSKQKVMKIIKSNSRVVVLGSSKWFQAIKWHDHQLRSLILINNDVQPISILKEKQIINQFVLLSYNNSIITVISPFYKTNYHALIQSLSYKLSIRKSNQNQIYSQIKMFLINNNPK